MKIQLADCEGCRNDFYNHNRMGLNEQDGEPRCWSFKDAEIVTARDIPINLPPPYLDVPHTQRPNCYKASGFVRVKDDALNEKGYWK